MLNETFLQPFIEQSNVQPFNHFVIPDILPEDICKELLRWLEIKEDWEYTGTSFYTQFEFSLLHADLPKTLNFLTSQITINTITNCFTQSMQAENLNLVDITVHKLVDGYRMGVHNDYLGNKESHRLVVQINAGWKEENGGYLILLHSRNPEDISTLIRPVNNSAIGFEISKQSYHAVSTIHNFVRYTLVYTFRSSGEDVA